MSVNEKMTALADEIRELSGTTTTKSIDTMTSDVDAANTEISSQADLITQISTALEGKAAGGTTLPDLNNPAGAGDILSGKEAIDENGNIVTGTIATKTASNLTASGATVTVPAGYYAANASKAVVTATQATPTVSVNSSGLITASATQTAGYVAAGTKSGTKQLTTQAAKTITPGTSSQTAVAKNVYTTGAVTVAAIPSNYEDVETETDAYTSQIESLASAVTALETELDGKAGEGGSSGANIETCTVQLTSDNNTIVAYMFSIYENNTISMKQDGMFYSSLTTPITIENVICGSAMFIHGSYSLSGFSISGGEFGSSYTYSSNAKMYTIIANNGSDVIINCYNND